MSEKDLVLTGEFNVGESFVNSKDNSIARPFRKILTTGEPNSNVCHVFVKDTDGKYYTLGSLVRTPRGDHGFGERLLFFPGLRDRELQIEEDDMTVDHMTAEEDGSWHITAYNSEDEKEYPLSNNSIDELDDKPDFWMSLACKEINTLEKTPAQVKFQYSVPASDTKRRMNEITRKWNEAEYRALETPDKMDKEEATFLNFELYIDWEDEYEKKDLGAVRSRLLDSESNEEQKRGKVHSFVNEIEISGFPGKVFIRMSRPPGDIEAPSEITAAGLK